MADTALARAFAKAGRKGPAARMRDHAIDAIETALGGANAPTPMDDSDARKRLKEHATMAMKRADCNFDVARGLFLEALMEDGRAFNALMGGAAVTKANEFLHEVWNEEFGGKPSKNSGDHLKVDAHGRVVTRNGGEATIQKVEPSGRVSPAAPSLTQIAGAKYAAAIVAKSVLDSFAIIDRNGERLPVGDIYVSSYGRLITMTAKRSWRAHREHHLIVLLKNEAERRAAFIPADAKTRDIFDAKTVEHLLTMATTLANPELPSDATGEINDKSHA